MTKARPKPSKPRRADPNEYPPGWDRKKVEAIIRYYDARKDEDVLGDDAKFEPQGLVWIGVPADLVPTVRRLIAASRRTSA